MDFNNKKQNAFTLAEVLITLLIIGVISAIVIPSVINDTQNTEFKAAYKKAFAVASQATNQARTEGLFMARTAIADATATAYNFNIFKSYFSITKECINNDNSKCWNPNGEKACDGACGGGLPTQGENAFVDNAGMVWSIYFSTEDIILVDTNGDKAPNRFGRDRWMFGFKNHQNQRITVGLPYKLAPFASGDIDYYSEFCCHYPTCYYHKWLKE